MCCPNCGSTEVNELTPIPSINDYQYSCEKCWQLFSDSDVIAYPPALQSIESFVANWGRGRNWVETSGICAISYSEPHRPKFYAVTDTIKDIRRDYALAVAQAKEYGDDPTTTDWVAAWIDDYIYKFIVGFPNT